MSIINAFNDPIITLLRSGNIDNPFIYRQDRHIVINNYVTLLELPDPNNTFQVLNPDEETETYVRITSGTPTSFQYKVDFTHKLVEFHPDSNGKNLLHKFFGRGIFAIPYSSVWTQESSGTITETLQDVVDNTKIIYKPPVTNFSDLDIIYLTPMIGWRVQVKSTNKIYRYNGDIWEYIEDASNITSIEVRSSNPTDDLFNGRMWLIN